MKKRKAYQSCASNIGLPVTVIPKFLSVRWRYMVKVAKYVNVNDRPLYNYYSDLQKRHQADPTKVKLSETEKNILSIYLGKYIMIRLFCLFIVAACKEIIDFIIILRL